MRQLIICDFDETITDRDTISILGELPYVVKPDLEPKWSYFSDMYMRNYKSFLESPASLRRDLPLLPRHQGEITSANFQTLFRDELACQTDARHLELSSTSRMARYDIFAGIKHSQVSQFARRKLEENSFSLRSGFEDFMNSVLRESFFVVSVNWSAEFIQAAIGKKFVSFKNIYCNQLLSNMETYTGQFSNQLLTGSDKVFVIEKILAEQERVDGKQQYWYIGDSETDILALLHPKVNGVLLIDPSVKEQKFRKLAVQVLGLSDDVINGFISSNETGWLQCYTKNGETSLFLAKSWLDLKNIMSFR